ncbi:integrator complex subunit 14-like isoform X3 [Coccinella septempunctata]|uniref:integrator complex subunit 14-like isoform X3 n=1 Tax=Coccinella septempunctata TaxID=41139 RepID=UPI001D088F04|nr:integrator complex subunit 14-like isoform X3 [Coccinella septempunctata]
MVDCQCHFNQRAFCGILSGEFKFCSSSMCFSSLYEEKCPFTRDYNSIKATLQNIDDYDKTCIETALHGVNQMILGEWGNNMACQIVLVTDGSVGVGPLSLKGSLANLHQRTASNNFPVPFSFPAKLHIVCITPPTDPCYQKSKPLYQKLIDLSGYDGSISVPDQLSEAGVTTLFQKLAENIYTSFNGTLKCGNLKSKIMLYPAPVHHTKVTDFDCQTYNVSDTIEVLGFIPVTDIGSPMAVSRHLILHAINNAKEPAAADAEIDLTNDEDMVDEGKTPSFCVLLHGALKVENMAALVSLADNWFGFIYSWADTKKKSNLMLTLLVPGPDSVPWLGNLNNLGCAEQFEQCGSFPIRPTEKRSYSQNGVVWIRPSGLQSDIQKILRHARKLPEKTQQFYKELNRLRKAAISLGFLELLLALATIFEQECLSLPGNVHPDCAVQLHHAANLLKKTQSQDAKFVITPYVANYNNL